MDEHEETQKLLAPAMTQKLCVRVEFGVNKAGAGMYYVLFDTSAQVTEDGVCRAFKALSEDVFFGKPGIAPACCKDIKMTEHDQLQVNVADMAQTVDSVHMLCQSHAKPQVKVTQEMDGLAIQLPRICSVCGTHITCGSWSSNVYTVFHDGAAEEVAERSLPEALGSGVFPVAQIMEERAMAESWRCCRSCSNLKASRFCPK